MDRAPYAHHLYISRNGHYLAVAEFERHVQVWDLLARQRIAAFETIMDFGGYRLAVTDEGASIVAGAYHRGIKVYDVASGTERWSRKDLTGVQNISITIDQKRALCGFEKRGFESLNVETGKSKTPLRGVKEVFESEFEPVRVCVKKNKDYILTDSLNQKIATIPRETFAPLWFAFSPEYVIVSESGGRIRCHGIKDGHLAWAHNPEEGTHALRLALNAADQSVVALLRPYRHGGAHRVATLCLRDGSLKCEFSLEKGGEFAFFPSGTKILAADGTIWDCENAKTIDVLDFFPGGQLP